MTNPDLLKSIEQEAERYDSLRLKENARVDFKAGALLGLRMGLEEAARILPEVDCSVNEVQEAERPCCAALQIGIESIRARTTELLGAGKGEL
jgi:hypothetical protein